MNTDARPAPAMESAGSAPAARSTPLVPVMTFGRGLSCFFAVTYVICILGYLLIPGPFISHSVLALFLPGFKLLDWPNFALGLAESFAFGWYVALVFGPIYNFFAVRRA